MTDKEYLIQAIEFVSESRKRKIYNWIEEIRKNSTSEYYYVYESQINELIDIIQGI